MGWDGMDNKLGSGFLVETFCGHELHRVKFVWDGSVEELQKVKEIRKKTHFKQLLP